MSAITRIYGVGDDPKLVLSAAVSQKGAQLLSFARGVQGVNEFLWQGQKDIWPRRAPILFPCVGVLRDGHATSAAGEVTLGRHGLARDYDHAILSHDRHSVAYELNSTDETRAAYPFDFKLNMTYRLTEDRLVQTFRVENTGDRDLPFTLGGHPAFNVRTPFEEWSLVFPEAWTAETPAIDAAGLTDFGHMTEVLHESDRLPLSHELFERLATITFRDVPGRSAKLDHDGHGLEVGFDGFDYLGVWTAGPTAPFIAVEPWCGCSTCYDESDVWEEKRGTIVLAPGESVEKTFWVRPY